MNFDWWSKKDIKQGYNTDWRSQVTHTHTQVSPIPGHGMGMKLEPGKLDIRLLPLGLAMMDNMVIVMVVIVQV